MKKLLYLILFLTAAGICQAQEASQEQEHVYRFDVGDFTELTVLDNLNVVYRCVPDSAGVVVFSTKPAYARELTFENKKQKLKIQNDGECSDSVISAITVYSNVLTSASNWGNGNLTVDSVAPGAQFKAKVIGNGALVAPHLQFTKVIASVQAGKGRVYLAGKARTASLRLMSAGTIEAGNLAAAVVRCRMYGTGSIDCSPEEELSVGGITSGTVYYKGSPAKVTNRSIGGHIVKIDAPEGKATE